MSLYKKREVKRPVKLLTSTTAALSSSVVETFNLLKRNVLYAALSRYTFAVAPRNP